VLHEHLNSDDSRSVMLQANDRKFPGRWFYGYVFVGTGSCKHTKGGGRFDVRTGDDSIPNPTLLLDYLISLTTYEP